MIDRLHASLTRTVIPLIHCVATDAYQLCTLSNTAHKRRQSTADCGRARWIQPRHLATWLQCETPVYMRHVWMTSIHHSRFAPVACLETRPTQFMSVAFQPATFSWPTAASRSCNACECCSRVSVRRAT